MYILENFGNPKGKLGSLLIKMMNKGHRKLHLWGISYLNVNDDDNILDIGCGGGSAIKIISEKYSSCNIYGIDISECLVLPIKMIILILLYLLNPYTFGKIYIMHLKKYIEL